MPNTLDEIIANKRKEVDQAQSRLSLSMLKAFCEPLASNNSFAEALQNSSRAIIAECKKKSPSKGVLVEDYRPVALAAEYQAGGAAAISVLTDKKYFGGSLQDLEDVAASTSLPVMRKDFIIDEYQIYEARRHGASSFLLMAGVLDLAQLQYFIEVGRELGMEPLVESHDAEQLETALQTDGLILGINNRNLKTMGVDGDHAKTLVGSVDAKLLVDRILVYESGIQSREGLLAAERAGFRAFLIGEYLATQPHPSTALGELLA